MFLSGSVDLIQNICVLSVFWFWQYFQCSQWVKLFLSFEFGFFGKQLFIISIIRMPHPDIGSKDSSVRKYSRIRKNTLEILPTKMD